MERGIKRRRDLGIGEVRERKKVCGGFVKGSLPPALKKKAHGEDNVATSCRAASICREEGEGRGSGVVPDLIDGTIWKRREAGSLMSLRIDEDKMGPGSGGNNLWAACCSLWAASPARPASDRRFPHLPPSGSASPLQPG